MKKYELTSETKVVFGRTLHRIQALISFGNVEAGELGGWVEKEENLDHSGDARVYGNEKWMVFGPAGSRNDFTTFFACADGSIGVKCGCFYGNLDDFAKKVQATHGDNDHAKIYKAAIEVAKLRIRVGEVNVQ